MKIRTSKNAIKCLLRPSITRMWNDAAGPFREIRASLAPPHNSGCNGWNAVLLSTLDRLGIHPVPRPGPPWHSSSTPHWTALAFIQYPALDRPSIRPAAAAQLVLPRGAATPASRDEALLVWGAALYLSRQMPRRQRPQGPSRSSQMGEGEKSGGLRPAAAALPCQGPPARVRSSVCAFWRQNALLVLRCDAA